MPEEFADVLTNCECMIIDHNWAANILYPGMYDNCEEYEDVDFEEDDEE